MTGLAVAAVVAAGLIAAGLITARRPVPPPAAGWAARLRRAAVYLLLLAVGAVLVARAGYSLATEHPGDPGTYQHAWGGPHYIGFIIVHVGPAVLVLFLAGLALRRRLRGRRRAVSAQSAAACPNIGQCRHTRPTRYACREASGLPPMQGGAP